MNILLVISLLMYSFAIVLSFTELYNFCLIFLLIAGVFELIGIKKKYDCYNTVILIFALFSIIYGVSGPITCLFGNGNIGFNFVTYYNYGSWFLAYSLSQIGFIIGFCMVKMKKKDNLNDIFENKNVDIIGKMSIFIMVLSAIFFMINLHRIGGISTLLLRKAVYQSRESMLTLTLPANELSFISLAFFAIYVSQTYQKKKCKLKYIIFELLFLLPLLLKSIILGQRGFILNVVFIVIMGISITHPIKKMNGKLLRFGVIMYLLLVFIYTNRAIVPLLQSDKQEFFNRIVDTSRYVSNLNPGSNEFSAAFVNYNTFINNESNISFKYGESYLRGLALPIPSFLYPGTKPTQITYEFRNKYFSSLALTSSIASTGFSSILEAYWNFGYIGVVLIYLLYGIILGNVENKMKNKNIFSQILYLCICTCIISFSRYAFGDIFTSIIYFIIYIFFFLAIIDNSKIRKGVNKYE